MIQIPTFILKIALERIRGKIKREITDEEYGFREGKGTRIAIFIL